MRIFDPSSDDTVGSHQRMPVLPRGENRGREDGLSEVRSGAEEDSSMDQAADIDPCEVDRLIDEAREAALREGDGTSAAARFSQMFHSRLQRIIKTFKRSSSERTFKGLGEYLGQMLKICRDDLSCRSTPMAGSRTLFPLPVSFVPSLLPDRPKFLQALAAGLNDLNGSCESDAVKPNPISIGAMKRLAEVVEASNFMDEKIPDLDFHVFLKSRKVDYRGEEVKVAQKLVWRSLELAMPDEVGTLHLRDFCDQGTLHFIDNVTELMIPEDQQTIGKTPRVMVEPQEWPLVAEGLVRHGICKVLGESEVHHIQNRPLLNGMFSVSKNEWKDNIEITRLIMNLRPTNANSRCLMGDTGTLPTATSIGAWFLDDNQSIVVCSEDIRCFFYLFQLPEAWLPFLAFGMEVPDHLKPPGKQNEACYLCSRVLPMGYLNSVGLAQMVHRNVVRQCMGSLRPPLGGQHELRRDKVASCSDTLFRVYLDNFDLLRKFDPETADIVEGRPGYEIEALRESYQDLGLPRHPKKSVVNQTQAEVQGAWVDGHKGTVAAKASKAMKYVALALDLLQRGVVSQRELQVLGGGFVYLAMFKRPLLSSLNHIWSMITAMSDCGASTRWPIWKVVAGEIVRFLCLLPLAEITLRLKVDPIVTASDASSQGGGVCMSRGITPYGKAASEAQVRGEIEEPHDFHQILSVGLFDGIAALRVALDILKLPVAGHISIEKNPEAQRVVEAAFPDTIVVDDVEKVDLAMCQEWALRFSSVSIILLGGGPPCQGVSGLNSDRQGALKDRRSSLFKHVPRIKSLCRKVFPWAQIHSLAENVASMDYDDCEAMNSGYDCLPWYVDSAGVSPCHRPRLYWLSWDPFLKPGVEIGYGTDGQLPIQGEVSLKADFDVTDFLEHGCKRSVDKALPTFTTSRPSPHPLRRPAGLKTCNEHETMRWRNDQHRFPPYQYKDENCILTPKGEFRPPSIAEREVCLGFPVDYTKQCMKKQFHESPAHRDCRLTLLGNSWSIPVIAWLLSCLFELLGLMDTISVQDIVGRLTPGKSHDLQTLLLRPPLRHSTTTFSCSELLVQKLCGLVSLKGEDILLQSSTDIPVRYQRLRASVPARLWRWKDVAGWKWSGNPEHINSLELRSVFTTMKWRVEQRGQGQVRCVHLVDSLVVLHSLTRGRSSSRKLRRTMMRISSYLLCSGLQPIWAYVDTKQNPADRPSRRFVKKKWVKKGW